VKKEEALFASDQLPVEIDLGPTRLYVPTRPLYLLNSCTCTRILSVPVSLASHLSLAVRIPPRRRCAESRNVKMTHSLTIDRCIADTTRCFAAPCLGRLPPLPTHPCGSRVDTSFAKTLFGRLLKVHGVGSNARIAHKRQPRARSNAYTFDAFSRRRFATKEAATPSPPPPPSPHHHHP
jgi:hypothetical protein